MFTARRNAIRLGVAGVVVAGCFGAVPARAHNGIGAAFKGAAGRYEVYAYDGSPVTGGHLEYRLVVLDLATLQPIYGVRPEVTAVSAEHPTDATERAPITTYGNIFFYDLPNPYPGHWRVHLVLRGKLGTGSVEFRMHGAASTSASSMPVVTVSNSTSPWPVIGPVIGAAVLAGSAAQWWLRRRRVRPRR